jgi:hypothetical protein
MNHIDNAFHKSLALAMHIPEYKQDIVPIHAKLRETSKMHAQSLTTQKKISENYFFGFAFLLCDVSVVVAVNDKSRKVPMMKKVAIL